jgi:hypothetical protein
LADSISVEQSRATTSELSSSSSIPVILLASSGFDQQGIVNKSVQIWVPSYVMDGKYMARKNMRLLGVSQRADRACSQAWSSVPPVEQKPGSCWKNHSQGHHDEWSNRWP